MIPAASTFVPTMKPGTSIRNTSGIPKASQRFTKRAALSAESLSRMPPRWRGWEPTTPPGIPPVRAAEVARLGGPAPHRRPSHGHQAGDDRARPLRFEIEPFAVVDDQLDRVVH